MHFKFLTESGCYIFPPNIPQSKRILNYLLENKSKFLSKSRGLKTLKFIMIILKDKRMLMTTYNVTLTIHLEVFFGSTRIQ